MRENAYFNNIKLVVVDTSIFNGLREMARLSFRKMHMKGQCLYNKNDLSDSNWCFDI